MSAGNRVLVVGAGVGGLCAATHLARAGFDVQVIEKNAHAGGRCGRFERQGHRFDTGPTLFVLPELYDAELSALGVRTRDVLDLVRVDPTYRVVFADGTDVSLTRDLTKMRAQLEALEPGSFEGFLRYLEEGRRHYDGAMRAFMRRDFRSARDLLSPSTLKALGDLKLLVSHYSRAARSFRSPKLRAAFTFQDLYVGLSPLRASALFSLIPYSEIRHGVWYPRGGMSRVTDALVQLAREAGVRFRFEAPVKRIEIHAGRATGVTLRDGHRVPADVVLANADVPYVFQRLLPPSRAGRRMRKRRCSYSAITFFWGVGRALDRLDPHMLFVADDYLRGFDELEHGARLSSNVSFYLHAPARIDPGMAPRGEETLIATVPVGTLGGSAHEDWSSVRDRARRLVLDRLAAHGLCDLDRSIKFELSFTPRSWQRRYNLARGAAHGLGHELMQLGPLRPANRHPRFANVYFAGASTHPGSGIPSAMVSGRLAAERISEEQASAGSRSVMARSSVCVSTSMRTRPG